MQGCKTNGESPLSVKDLSPLTHSTLFITLNRGLFSGLVGSLCGVGGGVVIIPVLKLAKAPMTIHQLTGTSLASVTIASCIGASSYYSQGWCDVEGAAMLSSTAMFSAALGSKASMYLSGSHLSRILAVCLLAMSPIVYMKPGKKGGNEEESTRPVSRISLSDINTTVLVDLIHRKYHYALTGCLTGFLSGLVGVGGGIVMTSWLATQGHVSQHEAIATSLLAMVPAGLSGTVVHALNKNVNGRAVILIAASCSVGMLAGSNFIAPYVDDDTLRKSFAIFLGLTALRMF